MVCFLLRKMIPRSAILVKRMGGNPGGDGGVLSPPQFCRWGTQYQMSPHVFVVGRFFVGKIRILTKFVDLFFFFFFFLLVRMSESDRRVPLICRLKIVNTDGAAEKKVSESPPPPPPAHQLFWELRNYGLVARLGKNIMSPPLSPSDFRPWLSGSYSRARYTRPCRVF